MNNVRRLSAWTAAVLSFCLGSRAAAADAPARPNIVFILADDLGWADLGCYGSTYHRTPNLDRLARSGVRFTEAYAACCVCSPTRASILTGKYPARLNLTDWLPGRPDRPDQRLLRPVICQELPLEEVTLAEALKPAGYVSASIGKWHLGGAGFGPAQQGFDVNIAGTQAGSPTSYFAPFKDRQGRFLPGLADVPAGEYLPDRLTTEAERFIEQRRNQPFFLYFPHFSVHIPLQAKKELAAKYRPGKPGEQGNPVYAAMVESLDESVGRILKKLDDLKLADRTIVVFTSDNGGLCTLEGPNTPATINAPLREGKGYLYEGGIREPLLVRWPGVTNPGSVCTTPVCSIDFFPTILDGCAVQPSGPVDGVSLLPLLRGSGKIGRDALFWHYPHYSNQGGKPGGAVRAGDYKLIEFYEDGLRELFNLKADVRESHNLAQDRPEVVTELAVKLKAWRLAVGARGMKPNPSFVPNPQGDDGTVTLPAKTAAVHGVQLRYEPLPHKNTLGFWTRMEDWASWEFTVTKPGTFAVEVLQGCGKGQGGSEVEVAVGEQKLSFAVEDTGHFQNFKARKVGSIALEKAGRYTLSVKPRSKRAAAVMDLRAVKLVPDAKPTRTASEFRIAPLAPAEAVRRFQTRDGFHMDLLAAEPMLASPVALEYDENGNAYVLEMRDYPYTDKSTDKPYQERTSDLPLGRVRLLRDTDGDGVFDTSTIFADNLSWPTGLAFWKGGVFVAATPDIWYLKDTTGTGKADVRIKVYTGFRKFNVQAVINNLKWGLDHRIYGAGGTNGGVIRNLEDPMQPAVKLSANDFLFDPVAHRFEALSGGARFGHTFDDWGNRFLCNIRNPVEHVVLPAHYLARNPALSVRSPLADVAAAGETLPVYRVSPPEPWRVVRSQRWTEEGNPQGYPRSELTECFFTSACGVTVYRGDAYPKKYYGNAFLSDVAGNLIHREVLTPRGVTFTSRPGEERVEFVASTDNWFRPVNFVNAPDGTLHVVDMYRETIEHPWSIPDDIKAQLDLESGRERGRIYRLAPAGFRVPKPPRLGAATTAELVATLENPNAWWRETAHRLLYERQDPSAVEPLRRLSQTSPSPLARLHALWSLEGLKSLTEQDLLRALGDPSGGIREHAVRLAESRLAQSNALIERVVSLARDGEPRVRFQVAFSLGAVPTDAVTDALAEIARRDHADEWMRAAVLSSCADRAGPLLACLLTDATLSASATDGTLLRQLAQVVGTRNRAAELGQVLERLSAASSAGRFEVVAGLGEGLRRGGKSLQAALRAAGREALLEELLAEARKTAVDGAAPAGQRSQAIGLLAFGDLASSRPALVSALDGRQPPDVRLAAVRTLGAFREPDVANLLVAAWPGYSPPLRAEVVETLLARPERVRVLLDAVESRKIAVGDIRPARRAQLVKQRDPVISGRAARLFQADVPRSRAPVVAQYQTALALPADPRRGRAVFERECTSCHRLGGVGHAVGPDLETVRHHSPAQVLLNILDPNREVASNFVEYVVTLRDGRLATGILASETATGLTLRRAGDVQETVLRQDIEQITSSGQSLMPEGLEKKITPQEMADLLAFLLAPRRGTP